jgi:hypothetical protein
MNKTQVARAIINARYPRSNFDQLDDYFRAYGATRQSVWFLLDELTELLNHPKSWGHYALDPTTVMIAERFREISLSLISDSRKHARFSSGDMQKFLFEHHFIFKYGIRRWLLLNPGIAVELFTIREDNLDVAFRMQLQAWDIAQGDVLVHLHVVSNLERKDLQALGFDVPYAHWDETYYLDALRRIDAMLQSNPASIGLMCEDSWVFDPDLHLVASDGKPLVTFSFMKDKAMAGERFFVGEAKPDNAYAKQFEFALRSPRRRWLHKSGEYTPKTYGMYYAKELLHANMRVLTPR